MEDSILPKDILYEISTHISYGSIWKNFIRVCKYTNSLNSKEKVRKLANRTATLMTFLPRNDWNYSNISTISFDYFLKNQEKPWNLTVLSRNTNFPIEYFLETEKNPRQEMIDVIFSRTDMKLSYLEKYPILLQFLPSMILSNNSAIPLEEIIKQPIQLWYWTFLTFRATYKIIKEHPELPWVDLWMVPDYPIEEFLENQDLKHDDLDGHYLSRNKHLTKEIVLSHPCIIWDFNVLITRGIFSIQEVPFKEISPPKYNYSDSDIDYIMKQPNLNWSVLPYALPFKGIKKYHPKLNEQIIVHLLNMNYDSDMFEELISEHTLTSEMIYIIQCNSTVPMDFYFKHPEVKWELIGRHKVCSAPFDVILEHPEIDWEFKHVY